MEIKQFEDQNLSHYSYAILSKASAEMVLIDPARDPEPYYAFAAANHAQIIGVIETHPHADFVSSHLQIQQEIGAKIFASKVMNPDFSIIPFDEDAVLEFGGIKLKSLNTPGHSPDSISIVLEHEGKDRAVFTGDTLFIGDCGRPDLREQGEDLESKREALAKKMYHSLRDKLMTLGDEVILYPAHGAGTLCGKALSKASSSTIGAEKATNWSLQAMSETDFVSALTEDQPFIPKYFPYDVDLNKAGAPNLRESLQAIPVLGKIDDAEKAAGLDAAILVVDSRPGAAFKAKHLERSINIMDGEKFETWLGALLEPGQPFYLAAADEQALSSLIARTAKIGYEAFLKAAFVLDFGAARSGLLDLGAFKGQSSDYTIVDIRNTSEAKAEPVFEGALNIPLPELQARLNEIPEDKPVVVHCAGGYRSAAGSSILDEALDTQVFDLGDHIKSFIK
ncbi:MBL fold metallo-hydrolase [Pedobacter sp. SAFR-022]|uniref:MBL fold metallo-hydrolase n=1 Tax=Pedobacter sp. SAFR-022 TaxID=3436861 RepID=UPI003F8208A5